VQKFGVDFVGEFHRTFHVNEENRDVLALSFEGRSCGKDAFGEVLGGVFGGDASRGVGKQGLFAVLAGRGVEAPGRVLVVVMSVCGAAVREAIAMPISDVGRVGIANRSVWIRGRGAHVNGDHARGWFR
jgi:hypothetical protein